MENQVFVLLKERYEKDGTILSAGELLEKLRGSSASHDWVEGIYTFDVYLDTYHTRGK